MIPNCNKNGWIPEFELRTAIITVLLLQKYAIHSGLSNVGTRKVWTIPRCTTLPLPLRPYPRLMLNIFESESRIPSPSRLAMTIKVEQTNVNIVLTGLSCLSVLCRTCHQSLTHSQTFPIMFFCPCLVCAGNAVTYNKTKRHALETLCTPFSKSRSHS